MTENTAVLVPCDDDEIAFAVEPLTLRKHPRIDLF